MLTTGLRISVRTSALRRIGFRFGLIKLTTLLKGGVSLAGTVLGVGEGRSRREAETGAAMSALDALPERAEPVPAEHA